MILIVGSGLIAEEYINILKDINKEFEVIGNTQKKCNYISNKYNITCYSGGVENFKFKDYYQNIIIATPVTFLFEHLKICIERCKFLKNIFIEKPGCMYDSQIKEIIEMKDKINVYIAYNRRFFSSLLKCKEIINTDKINRAELEINEYNMHINKNIFTKEVLNNWFNCMTSHVVDMFFFIIGKPKEFKNSDHLSDKLEWHTRSSSFIGEGITNNDIKFKYFGDWNKNNKWKIKLFLKSGNIIEFQPLEKLKIIDKGKITIINEDKYDINFKSGYYRQLLSFLTNKKNLKTIEEQYYDYINIYNKISNYNMEYKVLLIGIGNIGFRYLQAILQTKLNIKLIIVDVSKNNIEKAIEYMDSIKFKNFKILDTTDKITTKTNFDLVIISTCSNIRFNLLKKMLLNENILLIKNLILEKIIFSSMDEFNQIEKYFKNKVKLNNIYMPSWWYHRFFKEIHEKYNLSNSLIKISGNNWGLACNFIHPVTGLLNIFDNFEFTREKINIIDSKRFNFKEINGTLKSKNLILIQDESLDYEVKIEIEKENIRIVIDTDGIYQKYKIYDNNNLIENYQLNEHYSSIYCIKEFRNLIYGDSSNLINYEIAKKGHKILIDTLSPIFSNYDTLPIT